MAKPCLKVRFMKTCIVAFIVFFGSIIASCSSTKKYIYFNDLDSSSVNKVDKITNLPSVKIERGDIIQVSISTIDREVSQLLNPTTNGITGVNNPIAPGYLVDSLGNIEIPLAGNVNVANKTTSEINEVIRQKLSKEIKNVLVYTRLMNFRISILGDVSRPGSYNISNDRVSILEAISLAGDLNITARRDNIMLVREQNGERRYISINLNDSKVFTSAYFYLINKDVIYIQPAKNRLVTSSTGFQILPTIFGGLSLALVIFSTFRR